MAAVRHKLPALPEQMIEPRRSIFRVLMANIRLFRAEVTPDQFGNLLTDLTEAAQPKDVEVVS